MLRHQKYGLCGLDRSPQSVAECDTADFRATMRFPDPHKGGHAEDSSIRLSANDQRFPPRIRTDFVEDLVKCLKVRKRPDRHIRPCIGSFWSGHGIIEANFVQVPIERLQCDARTRQRP